MPKTREQLDRLNQSRFQNFLRNSTLSGDADKVSVHIDAETGAGLIVAAPKDKSAPPIAHFYKPRETRFPFAKEPVTSNHMAIRLGEILKEKLAAIEAAKTAPHDLKIGDVIAYIFGATIKRASFHLVTDIPDPQHVTLVEIEQTPTWGTTTVGSVVPVEPHQPVTGATPRTCKVSMASGEAALSSLSVTDARRWNGKPVDVYQD